MKKFLYENGLILTLLALFVVIFAGQSLAGHAEYNEEQADHGGTTVTYGEYLTSGHFVEATAENWESEFLQMGALVVLTIFLRQKGSADSKKLRGEEPVDKRPRRARSKDAPWPLRVGGIAMRVYEHSLSIALFLLFAISFGFHAYGGLILANEEHAQHGKPLLSYGEYLSGSKFWFESFQNWQSEFLSVAVLLLLSIYLRQIGSPESKPVSAPHDETGE